MKTCRLFHIYVSGFGCMGDAVVCAHCGLDKYPEAAPSYWLAKLLGNVVEEDDDDYNEWADLAHGAREERRRAEA